ncbi:hypothetical protein ACOME3_007927 [Neoechinorhynchus agilis]
MDVEPLLIEALRCQNIRYGNAEARERKVQNFRLPKIFLDRIMFETNIATIPKIVNNTECDLKKFEHRIFRLIVKGNVGKNWCIHCGFSILKTHTVMRCINCHLSFHSSCMSESTKNANCSMCKQCSSFRLSLKQILQNEQVNSWPNVSHKFRTSFNALKAKNGKVRRKNILSYYLNRKFDKKLKIEFFKLFDRDRDDFLSFSEYCELESFRMIHEIYKVSKGKKLLMILVDTEIRYMMELFLNIAGEKQSEMNMKNIFQYFISTEKFIEYLKKAGNNEDIVTNAMKSLSHGTKNGNLNHIDFLSSCSFWILCQRLVKISLVNT